MMNVDLHLHTTASDGSFTPTKVVDKAVELGLKTIAITDHDTIGGIEEAQLAAVDKNLEVIPGIELNTDISDAEVHILGYYINTNDLKLTDTLSKLRNSRYNRAQRMVKKLNQLGIDITFKRVCQLAGEGSLGRVHIAQAIIESGYVKEISQAFDRYIGKGSPAYINRYKLTPVEAVKLVKRAGGVPVLAHPALAKRDYLIPELVNAGLQGLEVYHSEHDEDDVQHYAALAEEYELIKTGGSDCHGPNKGRTLIGTVDVPSSVVFKLKESTLDLVSLNSMSS
ncbi:MULTISPECIES: PHP domain-containing protein [unclassified Candidatus Frackibacter]|uniref:PHP domain-containing protein n=1 Tax=unclassified Candidatus Frackibacter TaxID=2648818 RepID=UPI0008870232|nr:MULTISPECIES: PHP domain-containing protein [unclassified Candidatus Frackibacter]SDC51053.1 hypothetical protein SAMN04515661_11235 [Candidatus Frackibacter sp. WG11]SEM40656.1 hypothetical protein SAMN04488698_10334 [Candidatus Frackibacter sp. WG12]SFL75116.1 hypothetical protein SAMN04488699_11232 [Candidatus Frackibacter sp. WG13]